MAYAFNEDKGKVDIDAILNGLQTNYQNNINTIYNALVNNGVTPTAKTPAAIATAINNIRSGGNATAAQILATRTAIVNKQTVTGSMANYSGSNRRTVTPSGGTGNEQLSLSAGYHDSVIVNRTNPYNTGYNAGVAAQKAVSWTEDFYLSVSQENSRSEAEFGLGNVSSWKVTSKGSSVSYLKAAYKNSSGTTVQDTFDVSVNTTYTPPSNAYYLVFIVYTSATGTVTDRKAIGTFTKYANKLH